MRLFSRVVLLLFPVSGLLLAQSWEVGAGAGYGVYKNVDVKAGTVSGTAGFGSGAAATGLLGNQINRWIGGEARYTFRVDNLRVKSGSTEATASAKSHAIHYDVLIHAAPTESPVRPFIAVGAGVKLYRGTGAEPPFQPLSNLVVLTHTNEAQPLISIGGGLKFKLSHSALFRLDFRDYATPMPSDLLAKPTGSSLSGWMHDFVFLAGISAAF
jgi:hypothetical protein